jgi:hypothetical protein
MVGLVLILAVGIGAVAVLRVDPWGENGNRLSERFAFDGEAFQRADPAVICCREIASFPTDPGEVRAIAAGLDNRIYVAADQSVRVFDGDGQALTHISLDGPPLCLAVAPAEHVRPGTLYVGLDSRVLLYDPDGQPVATWTQGLDDRSVLTSIAIAENAVFVADAGNRVVLRYDPEGQLAGRIGEPDAERGIRGFIIPSPHFDVAVTSDGLLRVVNPGARRIETYTYAGDLLGHWGKASAEIDGFFGCCNPSNLAVLPDGRFVTAEKGIPRVKLYAPDGRFEGVVADPETLGQTVTAMQIEQGGTGSAVFDVATDSRGRVLVLDPTSRRVRIFENVEEPAAASG